MHSNFNCITVKYNGTPHSFLNHLTRLCVTSNYPHKIIHSFNLVNTFDDLFHHIYMPPDWPVSSVKLSIFVETWSQLQKHSCPGDSNWTELHTLFPASQYTLRLVAINSVGTSHPSRSIDVYTKEEIPEGPPTDVEASASSSQMLVINWKVGCFECFHFS